VRAYLGDAVVLAVARAIAAIWSRHPLHNGVLLRPFDLVLDALCGPAGGLPLGEALRVADAQTKRVLAALVALGVIVKAGRGRQASYWLPMRRPVSERVAEALRAEMEATSRCEASLPWLAGKSAALALMGLEGDAAWTAMARLCCDVPGWHYGCLAGVDRVLMMSATQASAPAGTA
jgi:hypothetical protein